MTRPPLKEMPMEARWDRLDALLRRFGDPPGPANQGMGSLENQTSINVIAADIFHWANAAFPDRQDHSMFLKMYEELGELMKAGDDPEKVGPEVADILIMVLDYAVRKGVTVGDAVHRKMLTNKQREWVRDELGFFKHVK